MPAKKLREDGLFGTDGIRGTPGKYPLTDGMLFKIGISLAKLILQRKEEGKVSRVIIGRDNRRSGRRIEAILTNAIKSYGLDVILAGVIPAPGLAYLVKDLGADMGVMISASHNRAIDNGLKFFTEGGHKLSIVDEQWMEELILGSLLDRSENLGVTRKANIKKLDDAFYSYVNFLKNTVSGIDLSSFKVAVDCSWGATSIVARILFKELGIKNVIIHDLSEKERTTKVGALNPHALKRTVLEKKADVGFAFDGDGDRVILVDEKGKILDGDYIMVIIGRYLLEKGELLRNKLVTTQMSNKALEDVMSALGGSVLYCDVGDKQVIEALNKERLNFGGEQSGQMILLDYLPSPDGLLIALQILKIMQETGEPLSDLAYFMDKVPQVLLNVKVRRRQPFESNPLIWEALFNAHQILKDKGRLFVRYSGTESVVRIMAEGEDDLLINDVVFSLGEIFEKELGVEEAESYV